MYVKITNGSVDTYPYSVAKLRLDNPNTSFPKSISDESLADWGVYPVNILDAPDYAESTQAITENTEPVLNSGVWELGWTISSKSSDEIAEYNSSKSKEVRALRDQLLAETDFYALSDVTMSSEMQVYRQLLRDLPTHSNWPNLSDSDWPSKP